MTICRIKKVSEIRRWCKEMRENPAMLEAIESKVKKDLQEKTASRHQLAI
jgi:hypothetical protein